VPPELPARPFAESSELVECVVAPDGLIDPQFLPVLKEIWKALEGLTLSGELAKHLGASLARIGAGWPHRHGRRRVLGGPIALSWLGRSAGLPLISALFPAPKIALLPLVILWFAIGEAFKVAIISRCKRIASARIAGGRRGAKAP
jgi:ABC-type nitrate/sulfonate/bicarbonate transport system permease component